MLSKSEKKKVPSLYVGLLGKNIMKRKSIGKKQIKKLMPINHKKADRIEFSKTPLFNIFYSK